VLGATFETFIAANFVNMRRRRSEVV